jgi:molybdopterin-containing oxidoreductase family iron-sulfur binding subunit
VETLAHWSGSTVDALSAVQATWKDQIFKRQQRVCTFQEFWDNTLLAGFAEVAPRPVSLTAFRAEAVKLLGGAAAGTSYSVVLHSKVNMPDSRHAHNPWLQELPDPVTKVSWDNYVSLSPAAAQADGLSEGDVVEVRVDDVAVELPVHIQPGQHDRLLAIPLHYGCVGTERFASIGPEWFEGRQTVGENGLVGTNAAPLLSLDRGGLRYVRTGATIAATGKRHVLATTQEYDSLDVPQQLAPHGAQRREVVQQTTLGEFAKDHHAGAPPHAAHHDLQRQLWPEDHPKRGHHWGMVIDLNACTGCSACLVACQSENNVPVVGRDEVQRRREMYWIRVDRYYTRGDDGVQVSFQPMMCQHCDNAPCETVCPVLATVHSEEGLNQQVYNRCVGTRYCANNCPYKARRFNWFDYAHDDVLQNLALNPDVTVRSRGVMEKCSLCVQRIQDAKIEARRRGEQLADGVIQTACQQSCPTGAIVFGDLNDPDSRVSRAMKNPRRYRVLEELNVRPSVAYLRKVRNQ